MKKYIKESLRRELLFEGRLKLSPEDVEYINALIPKYVSLFHKGYIKGNVPNSNNEYIYNLGSYRYKMISGEDAMVSFWVGNSDSNVAGWFHRNDESGKNLQDNHIALNWKYLTPAFNVASNKIFQKLTGKNANEAIRHTLYHEMIHAKDPATNHHLLKAPYNITDESVYYKSWIEFPTMTGQLMEAIVNRVREYCADSVTISEFNEIKEALQGILDFYAGKTKYMDNVTRNFLEHDTTNWLQRFISKVISFGDAILGNFFTGGRMNDKEMDQYVYFLNKIKQYNPEGWKEFHKDLYLTIQECVEMVNEKIKNTNTQIKPMAVGGQGSFKDLKENKKK